MRLCVQRVAHASVSVAGEVKGKIGPGLLVLVGIAPTDHRAILEKMMDKCLHLRIFSDENGKINKSVFDIGGSVLLVSQFTLYADSRHGNRPGFTEAAAPSLASPMFDQCVDYCRKVGIETQCGVFGADMQVDLLNDGPFTIWLDSAEICPKL